MHNRNQICIIFEYTWLFEVSGIVINIGFWCNSDLNPQVIVRKLPMKKSRDVKKKKEVLLRHDDGSNLAIHDRFLPLEYRVSESIQ